MAVRVGGDPGVFVSLCVLKNHMLCALCIGMYGISDAILPLCLLVWMAPRRLRAVPVCVILDCSGLVF